MKAVVMESLGISREMMETYIKKFTDQGITFVQYEKNTDPEVQIRQAKDADILILANMKVEARVIEECEKLKFIDVAFTGVDHLPMETIRERGIVVSNSSGYANQAVAELTISFMIQLLRNLKEVEVRCREEGTKDGLVGSLLSGKTVGIIGAGAIGKTVARLCKAFGCRVIAYNRSEIKDMSSIDAQTDLETLLKESDLVSLHCPLTEETKNLLDRDKIKLMKKSAFLINTARGGVVDSEALAGAIGRGELAGAAVDVFETEPPIDKNHVLLKTPKVIVAPHIGFASRESLEMRAEIVFGNLKAWMEGKPRNQM